MVIKIIIKSKLRVIKIRQVQKNLVVLINRTNGQFLKLSMKSFNLSSVKQTVISPGSSFLHLHNQAAFYRCFLQEAYSNKHR